MKIGNNTEKTDVDNILTPLLEEHLCVTRTQQAGRDNRRLYSILLLYFFVLLKSNTHIV